MFRGQNGFSLFLQTGHFSYCFLVGDGSGRYVGVAGLEEFNPSSSHTEGLVLLGPNFMQLGFVSMRPWKEHDGRWRSPSVANSLREKQVLVLCYCFKCLMANLIEFMIELLTFKLLIHLELKEKGTDSLSFLLKWVKICPKHSLNNPFFP